jgi:hypothetical protein
MAFSVPDRDGMFFKFSKDTEIKDEKYWAGLSRIGLENQIA